MTDPTNIPGTSDQPGSLAWRIWVAKVAHDFFDPLSPNRAAIAELINKPLTGAPFDAWPVNDFITYIIRSGIPPGDATAISRLVASMERVGLLIYFGWEDNLNVYGQRYVAQHRVSAQTQGDLWLSEVLGADLIAGSYNPVTVRISRSNIEGSGSGLVLGDSHLVTNRHVVDGLSGRREVDVYETDLSFKWVGAELVTHQCRVWNHQEMDVAVVWVKDDAKPFRPLPGMVFRKPNWADEVYVFGYPALLGMVGEPITVQPGRVVNPEGTAAAAGDFPQRPSLLFSAIARPGNSGGPVVAHDGRVVGLVEQHSQEGVSGTAAEIGFDEAPLFYRGIPANEVVRGIGQLGFADLAVLEDPY